ncbi:restriction endonuclease subunit S [Methylobacterium sp. M6A4_1b]
MNAERLLAHYEKIADAPDAIARLRRFILDLAVRGKLVPQDGTEEPASKLLVRIEKEKARLVGAGELRKPRDLNNGGIIVEPFLIPGTWKWVRLDEVGAIVGGGTPSAGDAENFVEPGNGVPWLTPSDLGGYSEVYISRGSRDLSKKGAQVSSATVMPKGTVLFTSRAPIGYVAIAANPISTNQGFKSVVPYVADCSRFIAIAMKSFAPEIDAKAPGTTFKEVSGKIVAAIPFPLPPLGEQRLIVAKVDELMGLCDRIASARTAREAARDRLATASLARLNAPNSETFQDDAHFALDAQQSLTTRPNQIKALRQTILNLAVRGKLVPQDTKDEPASELLKRIAQEKAKYSGRNRLLPAIEETEKTFDVPPTWQWVRMGNVFSIRTGFAFKSSTYAKNGTLVFRVTNFDRSGSFDLSDAVFYPTEKLDPKISGFLLEPGEIIMVMVGGTIGKTTIIDSSILPALLNQNMWRIRSFGSCLPSKFEYFLVKHINQSIYGLTQSTHGHFAMSDYERRVFPLPPLAEQHRIVAKVDELMALCDQLEASLNTTAAIRSRLLEALLAEALEPALVQEL